LCRTCPRSARLGSCIARHLDCSGSKMNGCLHRGLTTSPIQTRTIRRGTFIRLPAVKRVTCLVDCHLFPVWPDAAGNRPWVFGLPRSWGVIRQADSQLFRHSMPGTCGPGGVAERVQLVGPRISVATAIDAALRLLGIPNLHVKHVSFLPLRERQGYSHIAWFSRRQYERLGWKATAFRRW